MRLHFLDLHPYILLLTISLLPFANSFVCPDGTRALCCLSNPFLNPKGNKVYQRCKLWLEYFNRLECDDTAGHVCCKTYLANGLARNCKKATAADSCPASYPPTTGPKPNDLGDLDGGSNPGGGHSPGDGGSSPDNDPNNPDNKPGDDDDGGGDGPWWQKRPSGLWKAKKVRRRDCAGASASLPTIPKSSPLLPSKEGNGNDEYIVAAMADNNTEEEGAVIAAAAVGKGSADSIGGDDASLESPPGPGVIHDPLDFGFAASGPEGEDFFKQTPTGA